MKPTKSYVRFYALREMRARPRTFLPLLAIFFGVMLLMANLLIWFQCELTTNMAYYRVETQMILQHIREDEIVRIEALPWVKQVEAVPSETSYICYIELKENVVNRSDKIRACLYDTIEELELQERSGTYEWYWENIHDPEKWKETYESPVMLNGLYMHFLEDSLFQPANIALVLMAMAMLFAVTVLVYRMKLDQARKEYACLTGMGLTSGQLERIQLLQGSILLHLTYIPATLLAMGTMWVVCVLSKGIYPQFDGNQALVYDIPWFTLGMLYVLYQVSVCLGILVCMFSLRRQSVSAMLRGLTDKIPFIAKSSVRFLSQGSFDGYRKLWKMRSRRQLIPVTVLFVGLILLPAYMFGLSIASSAYTWRGETLGVQKVCRLEATSADGSSVYGISRSLLEDLLAVPAVKEITFIPDQALVRPKNRQYIYYDIQTETGIYPAQTWMTMPLTGDDRDTIYATLGPDEILVGEDFPAEVGETVRLTWGEGMATVKIRAKVPELNAYLRKSPYIEEGMEDLYQQAAISPALYCMLTGDKEPYLESDTYIWADVTPETAEGVLNQIAICLGDRRMYLNDYDRQLHSRVEKGYEVYNEYYESRIRTIQITFRFLFLLVQSLYLMLCAIWVIGATLDFQLRRRKEEFSVLRALGLAEKPLLGICTSYMGTLFKWGIPLLYPVLVLTMWLSSPQAGLQLDVAGNPYWGETQLLGKAMWVYAITCGGLGLSYGGVSYRISRKVVQDTLCLPLAEAMKERE